MDKKDIESLLDALCDRPFTPDETSPEAAALRRAAAEALLHATDGAPTPAIDPDRAAALLAAIHSGTATEAERNEFAAAARSDAVRLDAQSALAFVDLLGQRPERAPAHLAASPATPNRAGPDATGRRFPAVRRWRFAAGFAVLFMAGALGARVYLQPGALDRAPEETGRPAAPPVAVGRDNPAPPAAVVGRSFGARHDLTAKDLAAKELATNDLATKDLAAKLAACPPENRAQAIPADVRPAPPPNAKPMPAATPVEADCPEKPASLANQDPAASLVDKADASKALTAKRRAEAARRAARIQAINPVGAVNEELDASPPAAATAPTVGRAGVPAAATTAPPPMAKPTK
jgi:hypothetical protein